jgi:hypothetical protein
MCPINLDTIKIDHIVDFAKDRTTFVAVRENGNNHLRIFLVYQDSGNVYTRNGRAETWEELFGRQRETILNRILEARQNGVSVYRLNGSHN